MENGQYTIDGAPAGDSLVAAMDAYHREVAANPGRLVVLKRRDTVIIRSDRKEQMC